MQKILFLILLLVGPAQAFAAKGWTRSECEKFLVRNTRKRQFPKNDTQNSTAQLLDSVKNLFSQIKVERSSELADVAVLQINGDAVVNSALPTSYLVRKGYQIPLDPIYAFHAWIYSALKTSYGLSDQSADEFAFRIDQQVIEGLGGNWADFRGLLLSSLVSLRPGYFSENLISDERFIEATQELLSKLWIDRRFDIPYVAGYAQNGPSWIFLDRDLPRRVTMPGDTFDPSPFICLHEAIEKALLQTKLLSERRYQRTHQIAQRLEMTFVLLSGHSWSHYQYGDMEPLIDKIWQKPLSGVPEVLDEIPYQDEQDQETLKRIAAARVSARHPRDELLNAATSKKFTLLNPLPGLMLFKYRDRGDLARSFLRLQEFYESPEFKGKVFSLEEFITWSKKKLGNFDYYKEWDGFNFPGANLESFFAGRFDPLSAQELALLQPLRALAGTRFYVVGVAENSEKATLAHELSHALFYLNPQYRREVLSLLSGENLEELKAFLRQHYGHYHDDVILDEIHAWLLHNEEDLKKDGLDFSKYRDLQIKLKNLASGYPISIPSH